MVKLKENEDTNCCNRIATIFVQRITDVKLVSNSGDTKTITYSQHQRMLFSCKSTKEHVLSQINTMIKSTPRYVCVVGQIMLYKSQT